MLVVIILCLVLLGDSTTGAETECGQPQRVHGALPKPEYRDVSSFAHNATIEYRCDVTHYLVDLTSWFRTCLNGKWDDVQFRCIAKTCPALTTPDNGQRVGYNHEVGTFAKFKCNDGYEMMGVAQLLCRTDMEWSPKDPPTCKPVRCRDDSYLANGRVFQETFRQEKNTYGITNRYSCNSGYDIKGPSIRTCQADKTWSGIKPICDVPRCREITAEHGEVEYIGDRARYTYAFITCNEGFSFGIDGVETVECLRSLHWDNTLHCYKMVKSWNPENSYTRNRKDANVEHNEMYRILCNGSYEMKQNGHYLGGNTKPRMSVWVKNLNGKLKYGELDAHTLSCVEKRCFQRDINLESTSKVIVEPNIHYVEHGQSFHLSCENGYEDRLKGDPDLVCNSGKLKGEQPDCTKKPCVTPTIENGKLTRSGFFYKSWYTKASIISGQSVLASCENNFFLYDNSKNEFMKERSMSIICELGNMTSIPSCRKAFKCEFPDDPFASYYVNGDKQIGVNTISHDVEVRVKCESGTKITVSTDVRRCWNGAWESGKQFPVCEPEPCRVTKEKGRRFIKDGGEVHGDVAHGQTVTVVCDIGFDIIGANSDIRCIKGQFDNMYQCVEKPCRVTKAKGRRFIKDGGEVHGEVAHGQTVTVVCDIGFDIIGANSEIQCIKGQFDHMYQCVEKPCLVTKEKGRRFIERDGWEVKDDKVGHGQTVTVVCDIDFDRNDANSEIRCIKGQFDYMYQCVKRCAIPEIPNANITRLNATSTTKLKHGEMIKVTCPEGQRFQSKYTNNDDMDSNHPDSIFTCNNGTITGLGNKKCELSRDSMDTAEQPRSSSTAEPNATTAEPNATTTADSTTKNKTETSTESDTTTISSDGNESSVNDDNGVLKCTIPPSDDFKFLTLSGVDLIEGTQIHHGKQIIVEKECKDYEALYDAYNNDGAAVEESSSIIRHVNKTVNCLKGSLSDYTLVCDDVETPDIADSVPDECRTIPNGKVTDNGKSIECNTGYVNADSLLFERYSCICDRDIPAVVCNGRQAKCEPRVLNCTIPASDVVKFYTLSGGELMEGTEIHNGRQILAEKECKDDYEGYYDAYYNDDADVEESSPTKQNVNKKVSCSKGLLSNYTLVCDDGETPDSANLTPGECRALPNGNVTDNGQSFECNKGYVNADPLLYERYSCSCNRTIPALVCNRRQAKCEPINCKLNSPIEQGMTLKYKGTFITASTIDAIDHGGNVTFKCEIGDNAVTYEPKNRLFRCDRGNWIEHNRLGDSWSLGNNGTFPKCRPAKCKCQHGGTCIRDETCVCTTFSTGAQCERPICHGGCQNGGSCTFPNRCSCPKRFYGNRCKTEGCGAPVENVDDKIYHIGATYTVTQKSCSDGKIPSFEGQITCKNGHWSEKVTCLNGTQYSISVKTANTWRVDEGTDGEVYVYMFGSKGNSGKIILNGEFEAGNEEFTYGQYVDVGEISEIRLGVKAKSRYYDGWRPESVLIEDMSRRAYFKFVHDLTEIHDTSIILYPVAFCSPPEDLKNVNSIYFVGDELRLGPSNCAEGYKPKPANTKCTEEGWTADVVCVQTSSYRIRVKTVRSGTPQSVYIMIYGTNAKKTDWTELTGNFGPGQITEDRYELENIGQIEKIYLSVYNRWWIPDYVTIHVKGTDELYVFRYNSKAHLLDSGTELHPEGNCSMPFVNYRHNVVAWKSVLLKEERAKNGTDCKIQCIEDHSCKMAMFNSGHCRRYSDDKTYIRKRSNWIAYDLDSCYRRH